VGEVDGIAKMKEKKKKEKSLTTKERGFHGL